jgi:hypothetical protein
MPHFISTLSKYNLLFYLCVKYFFILENLTIFSINCLFQSSLRTVLMLDFYHNIERFIMQHKVRYTHFYTCISIPMLKCDLCRGINTRQWNISSLCLIIVPSFISYTRFVMLVSTHRRIFSVHVQNVIE